MRGPALLISSSRTHHYSQFGLLHTNTQSFTLHWHIVWNLGGILVNVNYALATKLINPMQELTLIAVRKGHPTHEQVRTRVSNHLYSYPWHIHLTVTCSYEPMPPHSSSMAYTRDRVGENSQYNVYHPQPFFFSKGLKVLFYKGLKVFISFPIFFSFFFFLFITVIWKKNLKKKKKNFPCPFSKYIL